MTGQRVWVIVCDEDGCMNYVAASLSGTLDATRAAAGYAGWATRSRLLPRSGNVFDQEKLDYCPEHAAARQVKT